MNRYLLLLCTVLLVGACSKDIVDTTGNLAGVVSDARTGAFLSGVSVSLVQTGKSYTTGMDGKYEFYDIPSMEYAVEAFKSGYKSDKKTVYVEAGKNAVLDFQLTPSTANLSVSPLTLDFGNETTTLSFEISNVGLANMNWQISENAPWLTCNPTSGNTHDGEKSSVVVTVNRNGLESGKYTQTIAVTSNGGSANVIVNLAVKGIDVSVSPEILDFASTTTSLQLSLTNTGGGTISYTLSPSNSWIKLSRASGSFTTTENVTVSVDRTSLSEGDHEGNITLTVGGNHLNIPVRMNIPRKEKPTVGLHEISNVSHNSATFKGGIVSIGSSKVIQHGFCWSTSENPTIQSGGKSQLGDTQTAKDFTYTATSLTPSTTYFVRAYAENTEGISYSTQMKFQTEGIPQLAELKTGSVSNIQPTQAKVTGEILNLGNTKGITQYGHVWSKNPNPTIDDSRTRLGTTTKPKQIQSYLYGLEPSTTYYVRAYATNSVGTAYGEQITFKTASSINISGEDYDEEKNWTR